MANVLPLSVDTMDEPLKLPANVFVKSGDSQVIEINSTDLLYLNVDDAVNMEPRKGRCQIKSAGRTVPCKSDQIQFATTPYMPQTTCCDSGFPPPEPDTPHGIFYAFASMHE